jgi:hypothetical protein
MYLAGDDVELLAQHFDDDPDIAWLTCRGPNRFVAVDRHESLGVRTGLWHTPSGPLPLLLQGADDSWIDDPCQGWTDLTGASDSVPYFGPGHPGVYWLNLRKVPAQLRANVQIGLSSIEWIGNHYRSIGNAPASVTEAHWRALRRWVNKVAPRIPRTGDFDGPRPEVFAFPAALEAIAKGASRDAMPF